FLREARERGSAGFRDWLERRETARRAAAALVGGRSTEVAFTTSTSQGLLTVAEGLRLAPRDEIVTLQDDFPANPIPWSRHAARARWRCRGATAACPPATCSRGSRRGRASSR